VKRWVDRWNAYWFPTTTTRNLALCRIVAIAAQLFWFFPSLPKQINLLEKNSQFIEPQLFIRSIAAILPRDVFFTPSTFTALYWITVVAGILALVGLFTRVSIFVFALGTWIFVAHLYSYADYHHPEAVFAIFLMVLAFAPSGASLSLDARLRRHRSRGKGAEEPGSTDMASWPLKLAHVLLALTYFSTGITKVIFGGPAWVNGYTLQSYLFADGIRRGLPLGLWMAQHHTLCVLLSVFTVLFELFFFVSLVLPRTAPFFFVNGILFQIGLFLAAGHPFFQHIVLLTLLLLFLEPEWWRPWVKRYRDAERSRLGGQQRARQPV
jgi:uncharacterized membrane protein YphA (DoxX/SURF4 family)